MSHQNFRRCQESTKKHWKNKDEQSVDRWRRLLKFPGPRVEGSKVLLPQLWGLALGRWYQTFGRSRRVGGSGSGVKSEVEKLNASGFQWVRKWRGQASVALRALSNSAFFDDMNVERCGDVANRTKQNWTWPWDILRFKLHRTWTEASQNLMPFDGLNCRGANPPVFFKRIVQRCVLALLIHGVQPPCPRHGAAQSPFSSSEIEVLLLQFETAGPSGTPKCSKSHNIYIIYMYTHTICFDLRCSICL